MSYWPKPKKIKGEAIYYVHKTPGTYTVNNKPGGKKVVTETVTLTHPLIYLLLVLNKSKEFAVGVCGNFGYVPHQIHVLTPYKFWPLLVVVVSYGWTKQWWKPWSYLLIKKGGPK